MVGPSYVKTLLPFQAFSMKSPSSSALSSMKIKTLTQTLIYAQVSRLIRAFSNAKSLVIHIYKENNPIKYLISNSKTTKKKHKHKKLFFGSFRLHYNWCSSQRPQKRSTSTRNYSSVHLGYTIIGALLMLHQFQLQFYKHICTMIPRGILLFQRSNVMMIGWKLSFRVIFNG
ncbi:hypothetical protein ERO13_A04G052101v2 [Gossypium hirsutum]|nr:hypothetical protein ERO13_A04G052101v2 [Gossypium hirsutum]